MDQPLIDTTTRLECLKLAQGATVHSYAMADEVVERAEAYADFVLGEMKDARVENLPRHRVQEAEDKADEAAALAAAVWVEDYFFVEGAEDHINFGEALSALKKGQKVARNGWNGGDMWLELQVPDAGSKMFLPDIHMKGDLVPPFTWLASQTDLLAEDWYLV